MTRFGHATGGWWSRWPSRSRAINGGAACKQKARNGVDLTLDGGHAQLGDYDDGGDELRQKIRVGKNTELAREVKI